MNQDILEKLEQRLGRIHARQRLGIENDNEQRVFGGGFNFFHIENWYSVHSVIRNTLRLTGLYWRGRRNSQKIHLRHNPVHLAALPAAFSGFRILQLSDLHVDMNHAAMKQLAELLPDIDCDVCVLTGDYRGRTYGPIDQTLAGMESVCRHINKPIYGVLGNHDSIRMVPGLEEMGVTMLLNESVTLQRGNDSIHIAGIDDAHYYRVDNMDKAAASIPASDFSVLLSHTPEVYRHAAHAGFNLLLGGHTHGGQICLPGRVPITLDAKLPRRFGSGAWQYHDMIGYTSVGAGSSIVPVRFNCPPEITVHQLFPM